MRGTETGGGGGGGLGEGPRGSPGALDFGQPRLASTCTRGSLPRSPFPQQVLREPRATPPQLHGASKLLRGGGSHQRFRKGDTPAPRLQLVAFPAELSPSPAVCPGSRCCGLAPTRGGGGGALGCKQPHQEDTEGGGPAGLTTGGPARGVVWMAKARASPPTPTKTLLERSEEPKEGSLSLVPCEDVLLLEHPLWLLIAFQIF